MRGAFLLALHEAKNNTIKPKTTLFLIFINDGFEFIHKIRVKSYTKIFSFAFMKLMMFFFSTILFNVVYSQSDKNIVSESFEIKGVNYSIINTNKIKQVKSNNQIIIESYEASKLFSVIDESFSEVFFVSIIEDSTTKDIFAEKIINVFNSEGKVILDGVKAAGVLFRNIVKTVDYRQGFQTHHGNLYYPFFSHSTRLFDHNKKSNDIDKFSNSFIEFYIENSKDDYLPLIELYNVKGNKLISRNDSVSQYGMINDDLILLKSFKEVEDDRVRGQGIVTIGGTKNYTGVYSRRSMKYVVPLNSIAYSVNVKNDYVSLFSNSTHLFRLQNELTLIHKLNVDSDFFFAPEVLVQESDNNLYVGIAKKYKDPQRLEAEYLKGVMNITKGKVVIPAEHNSLEFKLYGPREGLVETYSNSKYQYFDENFNKVE